MSSQTLEISVGTAADRILYSLKMRGPQTVAELGCASGVCGEAARQQLVRLAAEGLVTATPQTRGVGRPVQVWSLTPAGNARFPDGHANLAASLIQLIRTQLGEEVLHRLIESLAAQSRVNYTAALEGARTLREKVTRLAEIRTREGHMAECVADGEDFLFVEHHCPVGEAAKNCEIFCRIELETFRAALGPEIAVEPTEHIVHGSIRCCYRISPKRARRKK